MFIPGICVPCMLPISCFFAGCFLRATAFFLRDAVFRFTFVLGFGLLMPGMLWPSCCETTFWTIENDKTTVADKIKYLYCKNILFIILISLDGAGVSRKEIQKRPRPITPLV